MGLSTGTPLQCPAGLLQASVRRFTGMLRCATAAVCCRGSESLDNYSLGKYIDHPE